MLSPTGFPTILLTSASRSSVSRLQEELTRAQVEVTTGRHADMGLSLGRLTGEDLHARIALAHSESDLVQAAQAGAIAKAGQTALASIGEVASQFLSTLTGARSADGRTVAANASSLAADGMSGILNTSYAGRYLFGGSNADTLPLGDFTNSASAVVKDAFTAEFGFSPDDPAAASISADRIASFIDTTLSEQFSPENWTARLSRAASDNVTVRIGTSGSVDLSTNANATFARELGQAVAMVAALARSSLSETAYAAMVDHAISLVATAQAGVGSEQSRIGMAEAQLGTLTTRLNRQKADLTSSINAMEATDPYEAANRVNTLTTQLEASYAVTARISRLSILSYL